MSQTLEDLKPESYEVVGVDKPASGKPTPLGVGESLVKDVLKDAGLSSLDELRASLMNSTSMAALIQSVEQIQSWGVDRLQEVVNEIPSLASDISDERKQKETQKKLIEMTRVPGMTVEKEPEKSWPTPDFKR